MKVQAILFALAASFASQAAVSEEVKPAGPYAILRTFADGDAFWDYAAYDDSANTVYVARENGVTAVDLASGKVTDHLIGGSQVHAVVLLDGDRALVTNGALARATIFNRKTGAPLAQIPTGTKPDGAGLEPVTGTLVIMDGVSHDAVFANPKNAAVLGRLPLDGEPGSPVADGKGHVFSAIADHSEIALIDVGARKVVTQFPLPDCPDASGLALDRENGVLLVTCANKKALGVDAATGRILGSVPIAKYPDAIAFDPARKVFYVPCVVGRLVVVAEGKDRAPMVKADVPMPFGVHTEALDVKDGLLFLPAGDIQIPKTAGARPTVAPGTFKVLVVNVKE